MLLVQGIFYIVTGAWPFIHLRSFLAVTGPKTDIWLLHTVSALILAIGGSLALSGARGRSSSETRLLGIGSALGSMRIDMVHVARRRVRLVHLLDALAEGGLMVGWLGAGRGEEASEVVDASPDSAESGRERAQEAGG